MSSPDQPLSSSLPYLLRAMHEWMTDNGQTPLVVVDATVSEVSVPGEHIKNGTIVLNIAYSATRNLVMNNEGVAFDARFGGVSRTVYFPVDAVRGIYARESGQGMQFQESSAADTPADESAAGDSPRRPRPGGPGLRVVK